MLHHLELYVSDLKVAHRFWSGLLGEIGYRLRNRWKTGFTLVSAQGPYLTFVQVEERYKELRYHRCGPGLNHLAFRLPSRAAVDALHGWCLEHAVTCLYDDRYPFATGGTDYYALFVEDPDRIKIEFVAAT